MLYFFFFFFFFCEKTAYLRSEGFANIDQLSPEDAGPSSLRTPMLHLPTLLDREDRQQVTMDRAMTSRPAVGQSDNVWIYAPIPSQLACASFILPPRSPRARTSLFVCILPSASRS